MIDVGFFGGTGFLGSSFERYLLSHSTNINLTVLSRTPRSNCVSNQIAVDATDFNSLEALPSFNVVIHGIAESTNGPNLQNHTKIESQMKCTLNIAAYCKKKSINKLIFLSSGAVYGTIRNKIENNSNIKLDSNSGQAAYALAKLTSENFLISFCRAHDIELCILRCFSFAGPNIPINSHYAFADFISAAKNGNDILIRGDGKDFRSYMHHDDFSYILSQTIMFGGMPSILNVGSGEPITISNLANQIALIAGNVKVKCLNVDASRNSHYVPNTKLLKSTFKQFSPISLTDTIFQSLTS